MAKCKIAEDSSEIEEKFENLQNPKMRKLRHQRILSSLSSEDEEKLKNETKLFDTSHFPNPPASFTGSNSKFGMTSIHTFLFVQQCFSECEINPVL